MIRFINVIIKIKEERLCYDGYCMECEKYATYSDECLYGLTSQVNYEFSRKI